MLRLADRTMLQKCGQLLLLPEIEITLLFFGSHEFISCRVRIYLWHLAHST